MGVKNLAQIFTASIPDKLGHKAGHHRKIHIRRQKKNPEMGIEKHNKIHPFFMIENTVFRNFKGMF